MSLTLSSSPDDLRRKFLAMKTPQDVAALLDVEYNRLVYHIYKFPLAKRYTTFHIAKKSGGIRSISAPATALKIIQRKLNQVLQAVYQPKSSVHSYIQARNVVTNAKIHAKHIYVLNVDLKDFFPSIHFGRVRGMFMGNPYNLNSKVATVLAQICCFNNQLPQGAPTSPIVSNMICAKMDSQLLRLAEKYRCVYTRYADDITFSTEMPQFPRSIARISERTGQLDLGDELVQTVNSNGFSFNEKKIRLRTRNRRQEVTGLTVNRFPNVTRKYVNQIRAMLHAWKKYDLQPAEKEFIANHDKKYRKPNSKTVSFGRVVKGKIEFLGMVRGKSDRLYLKYLKQLHDLDPNLASLPAISVKTTQATKPLVLTEGKTDWKHLKSAWVKLKAAGFYTDLDIQFEESEGPRGDDLLNTCKHVARISQARPTIFLFDRDKPNIVKEVSDSVLEFKDWKNGVYSFAIPIPKHRKSTPAVCIELYYQDAEIKRADLQGRRLYMSNEFDPDSMLHLTDLGISTSDTRAKERSKITILDDKVYRGSPSNIALPKNSFADYIINGVDNFSDFDVTEFKRIFNVIAQIVQDYERKSI